MLKLTVAVLALALAGTAAAGWRDLRVDGSSEEAFAKSLEVFKDELSPARRYVFGEALKDIWIQGGKAAAAERREYTADDYYADVDGLSYEEIVTFTDPTGDTAKQRYRIASQQRPAARGNAQATQSILANPSGAPSTNWPDQARGANTLRGPTGQQ